MNNIIEPCCADRQLPHLLREEKGHAVVFQTNGDVTLEHLMKAIMLMSGDRPRVMTLAVPALTETMMAVIGRYMKLEWVGTLRLMTAEPLTPEMLERMAAQAGCDVNALTGRLELAAAAGSSDGLLAFSGPTGTVIVQGRIIDTVTPGLSLYAGVFGKADSPAVRVIADVWNAYFRAKRYEVQNVNDNVNDNGNDNGNVNDNVNLNDNQQKKLKRKKEENNNEPTEEVAGETPTEESTEAAESAAADMGVA